MEAFAPFILDSVEGDIQALERQIEVLGQQLDAKRRLRDQFARVLSGFFSEGTSFAKSFPLVTTSFPNNRHFPSSTQNRKQQEWRPVRPAPPAFRHFSKLRPPSAPLFCHSCGARRTPSYLLPCASHRSCVSCLVRQVKNAVFWDHAPVECSTCSIVMPRQFLEEALNQEHYLIDSYKELFEEPTKENDVKSKGYFGVLSDSESSDIERFVGMREFIDRSKEKRRARATKHLRKVKRGFRSVQMEKQRIQRKLKEVRCAKLLKQERCVDGEQAKETTQLAPTLLGKPSSLRKHRGWQRKDKRRKKHQKTKKKMRKSKN